MGREEPRPAERFARTERLDGNHAAAGDKKSPGRLGRVVDHLLANPGDGFILAANVHGDIVGVVAEREEQARAAADALEIDWDTPQRASSETQVVPMREDAGTYAALASAALTRWRHGATATAKRPEKAASPTPST